MVINIQETDNNTQSQRLRMPVIILSGLYKLVRHVSDEIIAGCNSKNKIVLECTLGCDQLLDELKSF